MMWIMFLVMFTEVTYWLINSALLNLIIYVNMSSNLLAVDHYFIFYSQNILKSTRLQEKGAKKNCGVSE